MMPLRHLTECDDGLGVRWKKLVLERTRPVVFVTVPAEESDLLQSISGAVTYGWGVIPVHARINSTAWQTPLFPKGGGYIVPIVKASVRKAQNLEEGDSVTIQLEVRPKRSAAASQHCAVVTPGLGWRASALPSGALASLRCFVAQRADLSARPGRSHL
jgi:hypothetical protein